MVYTKFLALTIASHARKRDFFQNDGSHHLRKNVDKQGLSNTDLQTATPARHFLEQSTTRETWKCKINRQENRAKEPKEGPCTHWKRINQFRAGSILWMKQSDKKVSSKDPQNGGHFSCRKPVPHLRTSTVSDSEASIHLAHVQHLWQSKLFVIFLVLARWRIRLCSELQLARQWLHMHFVIHVCWKKIAMQMSFSSKHFCKFCTMFGPQKGSWKMDPKMVPEFDPQNGVPKWHPKMGSKNGTPKVPFLDPILVVKFWHHFWVHFSTPFLGSKTWCKICKNVCC